MACGKLQEANVHAPEGRNHFEQSWLWDGVASGHGSYRYGPSTSTALVLTSRGSAAPRAPPSVGCAPCRRSVA